MSNYKDRPYHQLRRMYKDLPDEDKAEVSSIISNYYRNMIERSLKHLYPNSSEGEFRFAVIERMYRNEFSAEELDRIKASCIAFHQRQQDQSL